MHSLIFFLHLQVAWGWSTVLEDSVRSSSPAVSPSLPPDQPPTIPPYPPPDPPSEVPPCPPPDPPPAVPSEPGDDFSSGSYEYDYSYNSVDYNETSDDTLSWNKYLGMKQMELVVSLGNMTYAMNIEYEKSYIYKALSCFYNIQSCVWRKEVDHSWVE